MISNVYVCFACFNSQIQKCLSQFVVFFSFKFSILLIIDFTPLYCCCCCSQFVCCCCCLLVLTLTKQSRICFINHSVSSFVRFILNPFVNYFSPIFFNTNKHVMVIIKYFLFSICINHISHNLVTLVRLVKMTKGIL